GGVGAVLERGVGAAGGVIGVRRRRIMPFWKGSSARARQSGLPVMPPVDDRIKTGCRSQSAQPSPAKKKGDCHPAIA
ncbi:hypothetical protein U0E10_29040, partial [Burkholderia ubonensis]|uniref:hypothetical protein n=1 Tax=Burkholderia ubonensis TaxID=101571 RepID=UPI002AB36E22